MKQRAEIRQRISLEESLEEGALARLSLAFIIAYMAFFTMKTVPGFFSTDVEHFEHAFTIVFSAEYSLESLCTENEKVLSQLLRHCRFFLDGSGFTHHGRRTEPA